MTLLYWLCTAIFLGFLGYYLLCFLLLALVWLGIGALALRDWLGEVCLALTDSVLNTVNWLKLCLEKYLKAKHPTRYH